MQQLVCIGSKNKTKHHVFSQYLTTIVVFHNRKSVVVVEEPKQENATRFISNMGIAVSKHAVSITVGLAAFLSPMIVGGTNDGKLSTYNGRKTQKVSKKSPVYSRIGAAYTMTNNPDDNRLLVFARDVNTGLLSFSKSISTGGQGFIILGP